jgi:uncharacterized protein (DUF433 family)
MLHNSARKGAKNGAKSAKEKGSVEFGQSFSRLNGMSTALIKHPVQIVRSPGVQGGAACVANTRIPVFVLARLKSLGWNDAEILEAYPALSPEDLSTAWSYYADHRGEIDAEIEGNERWIRE